MEYYNPDYSKAKLPEIKDYRRTLLEPERHHRQLRPGQHRVLQQFRMQHH